MLYIYLIFCLFTAPCVANVQSAIEHIYPLVNEFRADDGDIDDNLIAQEARFLKKRRVCVKPKRPVSSFDDFSKIKDDEFDDSSDDESYDSDESQNWWMLKQKLMSAMAVMKAET